MKDALPTSAPVGVLNTTGTVPSLFPSADRKQNLINTNYIIFPLGGSRAEVEGHNVTPPINQSTQAQIVSLTNSYNINEDFYTT